DRRRLQAVLPGGDLTATRTAALRSCFCGSGLGRHAFAVVVRAVAANSARTTARLLLIPRQRHRGDVAAIQQPRSQLPSTIAESTHPFARGRESNRMATTTARDAGHVVDHDDLHPVAEQADCHIHGPAIRPAFDAVADRVLRIESDSDPDTM